MSRPGRRAVLAGGAAVLASAAAGCGRPVAIHVMPIPRTEADVTWFGAAGDGLQDDAPAIQRALDSGAATIHFPTGDYRLDSPLRPASGQVWSGDGSMLSRLRAPQHDVAHPFNLLHRTDGIDGLELRDLGFFGNIGRQRSRAPDGQAPFAVYLRGPCRRITIRRCRFEGFGDRGGPAAHSGGGGVILGPLPGSPDQDLQDIAIRECVFRGNGNVPGVYVGAGDAAGARRGNVSVIDNAFSGAPPGTRAQNCVYVLGEGPQAQVSAVTIAGNRFLVDGFVDAAIELNWVHGFAVTGNTVEIRGGLAGSSGILVRDGAVNGTIADNALVDRSGAPRTTGIVLLNFEEPGRIRNVTVSGNTVSGFAWRGIALDRGTDQALVGGNLIVGPTVEGVRVSGSENVSVRGNRIVDTAVAVRLAQRTPGPPTRGISIAGNDFVNCGGGAALIDLEGDRPDVRGLVLQGNLATGTRPGTGAYARGRFASSEGNRMLDEPPPSLRPVSAGEESGYERIAAGHRGS